MGLEDAEAQSDDPRVRAARGVMLTTAFLSLVSSLLLVRALLAQWTTRVCVRAPPTATAEVLVRKATSGVYWQMFAVTVVDVGLAITWVMSLGVQADGAACTWQANLLSFWPIANGVFSLGVALETGFLLWDPYAIVVRRGDGAPWGVKAALFAVGLLLPLTCTLVLSQTGYVEPSFQGIWCWFYAKHAGADDGVSRLWPFWLIYGPRLAFFGAILLTAAATCVRLRGTGELKDMTWDRIGFMVGFPMAYVFVSLFTMLTRLGAIDYLDADDYPGLSDGKFAVVILAMFFSPAAGLLNFLSLLLHAPTRGILFDAVLEDAESVRTCCGRCGGDAAGDGDDGVSSARRRRTTLGLPLLGSVTNDPDDMPPLPSQASEITDSSKSIPFYGRRGANHASNLSGGILLSGSTPASHETPHTQPDLGSSLLLRFGSLYGPGLMGPLPGGPGAGGGAGAGAGGEGEDGRPPALLAAVSQFNFVPSSRALPLPAGVGGHRADSDEEDDRTSRDDAAAALSRRSEPAIPDPAPGRAPRPDPAQHRRYTDMAARDPAARRGSN